MKFFVCFWASEMMKGIVGRIGMKNWGGITLRCAALRCGGKDKWICGGWRGGFGLLLAELVGLRFALMRLERDIVLMVFHRVLLLILGLVVYLFFVSGACIDVFLVGVFGIYDKKNSFGAIVSPLFV